MARCGGLSKYQLLVKDCRKVERVICSCTNPEQVEVAALYFERWCKRVDSFNPTSKPTGLTLEEYNYIRNRTETIGNTLDIKRGVNYE